MMNDKMCIGVVKDELMVRVGPERFDKILKQPNVREMDFSGRPMKGFVYVASDGFANDESLDEWVTLAIEFGKFGIVTRSEKDVVFSRFKKQSWLSINFLDQLA